MILRFAGRQPLEQTVQIFSRDQEYLVVAGSGSFTKKLKNLSSKQWSNTWNILENLNELLPWGTKWIEQLARGGCNLLDSNCQPKYQCSGGSLQCSHQKNIWFDCNSPRHLCHKCHQNLECIYATDDPYLALSPKCEAWSGLKSHSQPWSMIYVSNLWWSIYLKALTSSDFPPQKLVPQSLWRSLSGHRCNDLALGSKNKHSI